MSSRGAFGASEILGCFKFRGKSPEKPKGFFWSVQGGPEGNRNPSGLVFFCQRFLLEKQKKMLKGSCKFPIRVLTLLCVSLTIKTVRIRRRTFNYRRCLPQPLRHCAPAPLERGASGCRLLLERDSSVGEGEDVLEGLVSCGEDFESGLERVVDRLAAGFKDTLGQ